jgi:hypothetical protein
VLALDSKLRGTKSMRGPERLASTGVIGGSRGFMNRIILGAMVSLVFCAPAFGSTSIDLDHDWFFRTDPSQIGSTAGWQNSLPAEDRIGRPAAYLEPGQARQLLAQGLVFPDLSNADRVRKPARQTSFRSHVLFGADVAAHAVPPPNPRAKSRTWDTAEVARAFRSRSDRFTIHPLVVMITPAA